MAFQTEENNQPVPPTTTAITVPYGWHRLISDEKASYVSPSGIHLTSAEEVKAYLTSDTTCKCGLQCPLFIDKVFIFDGSVKTKEATTLADYGMTSCKHGVMSRKHEQYGGQKVQHHEQGSQKDPAVSKNLVIQQQGGSIQLQMRPSLKRPDVLMQNSIEAQRHQIQLKIREANVRQGHILSPYSSIVLHPGGSVSPEDTSEKNRGIVKSVMNSSGTADPVQLSPQGTISSSSNTTESINASEVVKHKLDDPLQQSQTKSEELGPPANKKKRSKSLEEQQWYYSMMRNCTNSAPVSPLAHGIVPGVPAFYPPSLPFFNIYGQPASLLNLQPSIPMDYHVPMFNQSGGDLTTLMRHTSPMSLIGQYPQFGNPFYGGAVPLIHNSVPFGIPQQPMPQGVILRPPNASPVGFPLKNGETAPTGSIDLSAAQPHVVLQTTQTVKDILAQSRLLKDKGEESHGGSPSGSGQSHLPSDAGEDDQSCDLQPAQSSDDSKSNVSPDPDTGEVVHVTPPHVRQISSDPEPCLLRNDSEDVRNEVAETLCSLSGGSNNFEPGSFSKHSNEDIQNSARGDLQRVVPTLILAKAAGSSEEGSVHKLAGPDETGSKKEAKKHSVELHSPGPKSSVESSASVKDCLEPQIRANIKESEVEMVKAAEKTDGNSDNLLPEKEGVIVVNDTSASLCESATRKQVTVSDMAVKPACSSKDVILHENAAAESESLPLSNVEEVNAMDDSHHAKETEDYSQKDSKGIVSISEKLPPCSPPSPPSTCSGDKKVSPQSETVVATTSALDSSETLVADSGNPGEVQESSGSRPVMIPKALNDVDDSSDIDNSEQLKETGPLSHSEQVTSICEDSTKANIPEDAHQKSLLVEAQPKDGSSQLADNGVSGAKEGCDYGGTEGKEGCDIDGTYGMVGAMPKDGSSQLVDNGLSQGKEGCDSDCTEAKAVLVASPPLDGSSQSAGKVCSGVKNWSDSPDTQGTAPIDALPIKEPSHTVGDSCFERKEGSDSMKMKGLDSVLVAETTCPADISMTKGPTQTIGDGCLGSKEMSDSVVVQGTTSGDAPLTEGSSETVKGCCTGGVVTELKTLGCTVASPESFSLDKTNSGNGIQMKQQRIDKVEGNPKSEQLSNESQVLKSSDLDVATEDKIYVEVRTKDENDCVEHEEQSDDDVYILDKIFAEVAGRTQNSGHGNMCNDERVCGRISFEEGVRNEVHAGKPLAPLLDKAEGAEKYESDNKLPIDGKPVPEKLTNSSDKNPETLNVTPQTNEDLDNINDQVMLETCGIEGSKLAKVFDEPLVESGASVIVEMSQNDSSQSCDPSTECSDKENMEDSKNSMSWTLEKDNSGTTLKDVLFSVSNSDTEETTGGEHTKDLTLPSDSILSESTSINVQTSDDKHYPRGPESSNLVCSLDLASPNVSDVSLNEATRGDVERLNIFEIGRRGIGVNRPNTTPGHFMEGRNQSFEGVMTRRRRLDPVLERETNIGAKELSARALRKHFETGDLVWGQTRGHTSWPGKLVNDTDVKGHRRKELGKVWVMWFGDHSYAQVEPDKLKTLSEGLEAHHNARTRVSRYMNMARRVTTNLEAAIQEAMLELDKQTEQQVKAAKRSSMNTRSRHVKRQKNR